MLSMSSSSLLCCIGLNFLLIPILAFQSCCEYFSDTAIEIGTTLLHTLHAANGGHLRTDYRHLVDMYCSLCSVVKITALNQYRFYYIYLCMFFCFFYRMALRNPGTSCEPMTGKAHLTFSTVLAKQCPIHFFSVRDGGKCTCWDLDCFFVFLNPLNQYISIVIIIIIIILLVLIILGSPAFVPRC